MPSFRVGPKSLSRFLFTDRRWYQLSDENIATGSSRLVGKLESSHRSLGAQTTTSDQITLPHGNISTPQQQNPTSQTTQYGVPVKETDMEKKSVRFAESSKLPSYWSSTPITMTTSSESQRRSNHRHQRRRWVTISVATFLCVAALVMISYVTYLFFETHHKDDDDSPDINTEPKSGGEYPYMPSHCADIWQPLAASSSQLFLEDKSDRYKSLVHWAIRALEDEDPTIGPILIPDHDLSEQAESWAWPCSPRDLALSWLADMDPMQLWLPSSFSSSSSSTTTSTHELSQRYALALLFYSTSGPDRWISRTSWLSETSVCQWTGVTCNPSSSDQAVGGGTGTAAADTSSQPNSVLLPNTVVRIQLSRNGLEGTIPTEVKLLSHLGTLYIYIIYHFYLTTVIYDPSP
jgi:hypothetical protein